MGYPRSQLVVPGTSGTYHCVARCVRRAFLCGEDALTGRCFDHRKDWVEARLLELAEIFSLSVLAYAVMSNHVHVVLRVDPEHAAGWSDEEVARRWVRLFPARMDGEVNAEACRRKAWVLTGNARKRGHPHRNPIPTRQRGLVRYRGQYPHCTLRPWAIHVARAIVDTHNLVRSEARSRRCFQGANRRVIRSGIWRWASPCLVVEAWR